MNFLFVCRLKVRVWKCNITSYSSPLPSAIRKQLQPSESLLVPFSSTVSYIPVWKHWGKVFTRKVIGDFIAAMGKFRKIIRIFNSIRGKNEILPISAKFPKNEQPKCWATLTKKIVISAPGNLKNSRSRKPKKFFAK